MVGDARTIYRANTQIFICSHLPTAQANSGAVWTRHVWGQTGSRGFAKRTERVAARIPVVSQLPDGSSLCAQADHSPPSSNYLWGNNSPTTGGIWPHSMVLEPDCRVHKDHINNWRRQAVAADHWKYRTGCLRSDRINIWHHQRQIQKEKEKKVLNTRVYQYQSHCGLRHDLQYFLSCIAL